MEFWGGKWRSSLGKWVIWEVQVRKIEVILGVNGVAMDRHGLILWENEATGSGKVSRYLLDLRDAIFLSKMLPETKKSHEFLLIFNLIYYRLPLAAIIFNYIYYRLPLAVVINIAVG